MCFRCLGEAKAVETLLFVPCWGVYLHWAFSVPWLNFFSTCSELIDLPVSIWPELSVPLPFLSFFATFTELTASQPGLSFLSHLRWVFLSDPVHTRLFNPSWGDCFLPKVNFFSACSELICWYSSRAEHFLPELKAFLFLKAELSLIIPAMSGHKHFSTWAELVSTCTELLYLRWVVQSFFVPGLSFLLPELSWPFPICTEHFSYPFWVDHFSDCSDMHPLHFSQAAPASRS